MFATELRAHLRVRTESEALLRMPGGAQFACVLTDISMGGAYLIRAGSGPFAPLAPGALGEIVLDAYAPGGPLVVEAEIVRAEPGGPGVAVRFHIYDDIAPDFVEHVVAEAAGNGVRAEALGMPLLQSRRVSPRIVVRDALRRLSPLAALGALWWGARILHDWLGAVL